MSESTEKAKEILSEAVFDVVLKLAIAEILKAVPFLAWPVINPIFVFLLTKVVGIVYEHLARAVTFAIIDIEVGEQKRKFDQAVDKLKEVVDNPDSLHGIQQKRLDDAKEQLKQRFRDLIRLQ